MRNSLRLIAALCLAAAPLGSGAVGAAADAADPVTRTPYGPFTGDPIVVTDLCPFPVSITGTQEGYFIERQLASGGEQLIFHGTETDVFSANGNTLVGLPYTFNVQAISDADGNFVSFDAEGIAERVPLPGGGEFFSAGRTDWMLHPDAITLVNPDNGRVGNVEGLCAALA